MKKILMALFVLLTACGATAGDGQTESLASEAIEDPVDSSSTTSEPEATPDVDNPPEEGELSEEDDGGEVSATDPGEGPFLITGGGVGLSDIGTQPSQPIASGVLLIIPEADTQELWDILGFEPGERSLQFIGAVVPEGAFLTATIAEIGDDGFAVELDAGEYRVCALNAARLGFLGCSEEPLVVDGPGEWGLVSSDGGFEFFD